MDKTVKTIAKGTALMTITSLIVKVLSAIYRVPFQNIVGNEGFYIYQQVYPLYGIGMTIALTGIPVYLSKIMVECQDESQRKSVLQENLWLLIYLCLAMAVFLFGFSQNIALWMGDEQLTPLIKVTAILFLFSPVLALYRGIYQGDLTLVPTAYSQLVEQFTRVVVIIGGAYVLVSLQASDYEIGTVAMAGSLLGAIGALVVLRHYRLQNELLSQGSFFWRPVKVSKNVWQRFVKEGLILSLFVSFLLLFQLIDSFVIKNQLVASGMNELASKDLKGVYDRGQPLVQLGLVVANVLISAFLPVLSRYWVEHKQVRYKQTVSLLLKVILIVSSAATIGLIFLMPMVNTFLFSDNEGQWALAVFMISIFLMSTLQGMQAVLQSQNSVKVLWISLVIGLVIKAIATFVLTKDYQIIGSSCGTLLGLLATNIVFFVQERSQLRITQAPMFMMKWLAALGGMSLSLFVYYQLFSMVQTRFMAGVVAVLGSLIGGSIYLVLLVKCRVLTLKEWLQLPVGQKILAKMKEGR